MFPASEMTRVVCCVVDNFLCCVEVPAPGTTQLNEMCVCVYVCVCGGGGGVRSLRGKDWTDKTDAGAGDAMTGRKH